MRTIEQRRILYQGGSYLITLPKPWVLANCLEPGQKLTVKANGKLTIEPPRAKPDDRNSSQ